MSTLVLIRHGESEWNARGVWTGSQDVHLTQKGLHDASRMGFLLRNIVFDHAFASNQVRTHETLDAALPAAGQADLARTYDSALNERDYGDFTGLNKWEVREKIGEEAFEALRRSWDYPVPNGETLKDVYTRTIPYFLKMIVPRITSGQNILVAAHGNSIRSLVKYIESINDDKVDGIEMIFGTALLYELDLDGLMLSKHSLQLDITSTNA